MSRMLTTSVLCANLSCSRCFFKHIIVIFNQLQASKLDYFKLLTIPFVGRQIFKKTKVVLYFAKISYKISLEKKFLTFLKLRHWFCEKIKKILHFIS